ncbi:MAG TPA: aminotransferase class V-fold PLP-dependent enzyme [Planctomycetes bacterium]|nr:aminotransferase class V-fold PLP-dependent enzyme [Planctomycetaceae bacterium]HIN95148.1 aminotransferase class V-fold PLP-dependent enzyme [Planctomycetota bacterium]
MVEVSQSAGQDWQSMRQQMPAASRVAYFDHAAVSPISGPAQEAIGRWATQAAEQGGLVWAQWAQRVEQVRERAAQLIGADSREIAFVANTTTGINLIAEGLSWESGDNVVTLANEFPSNLYPWMNLQSRGVETRRVPVDDVAVDLNRIMEACDEQTRLISVSWVSYLSGWRLDVAALVQAAHDRGILVFLDAIQGLGVFPLNVAQTEVDFMAADGHKWMLGPEGAGLLYIRQDRLEQLRPLGVGWHSVTHAHDFSRIELDWKDAAARYEGGSQNMAGVIGLGASLDMLASYGLGCNDSPLAPRVLEIAELASERLESLGAKVVSCREAAHRSGIVSFDLPGRDLAAERRRCAAQGVILSCRGGLLRISPHAYVNEEDVERLLEVLSVKATG